jgi:hypothetical protein
VEIQKLEQFAFGIVAVVGDSVGKTIEGHVAAGKTMRSGFVRGIDSAYQFRRTGNLLRPADYPLDLTELPALSRLRVSASGKDLYPSSSG